MALLSTPTTITVGSFPYATPQPGQAVLIGTNTEAAVKPSGSSDFNWRYALFRFYGSGCFVRDYSPGGAFVVAASGGHSVPALNIGACAFDFSDATWKRIDQGHTGVPAPSGTNGDYAQSQMNSQGVLTGSNGCIAPSHTYLHGVDLPSSLGGGSKGSYFLPVRMFAAENANVSSNRPVRFDLATGLWSFLSASTFNIDEGILSDSATIYDPMTNRYYTIACENASVWRYLVPGTWTWQTVSVPIIGGGRRVQTPFIDAARRYVACPTYIYGAGMSDMRVVDLNNISAGWQSVPYSGTIPNHLNAWHYYPIDGCWYSKGRSGNTLNKLQPPSGNVFTGTWVFSTVTIGGATLPTDCIQVDNPSLDTHHYGRFFYVPTLQCFAWIAGGSSVALIKPA
jgi:hypothetical protein